MNNIKLIAQKTLAVDSPDHLEPFGTRRDNTRNLTFNKKLNNIWLNNRIIKILDLGCSGGGFVKDCLNDGNFAIGLDGSDYSKNMNRAEWGTIPNNLFTCDITRGYKILHNDEKVLFDVITLWDVIEHIKTGDIDKVLSNVKDNLDEGGIIIMAVGTRKDVINGQVLHQTVKSESWWLNKFYDNDLEVAEGFKEYFRNQWVKGTYNYPDGFTIVLKKKDGFIPYVPHRIFTEKVFDVWADSKIQLILRRLAFGYIKR